MLLLEKLFPGPDKMKEQHEGDFDRGRQFQTGVPLTIDVVDWLRNRIGQNARIEKVPASFAILFGKGFFKVPRMVKE